MDVSGGWQPVLLWAMGLSAAALVAAAVAVPWLVSGLPSDYFSRPERAAWRPPVTHPVLAGLLVAAKNVLGAVLAVLGLVMLVTPGQGLVTLLLGLLLLNFPGKYRLERWLVMRPGVLRVLNWLRRRRGRPPFDAPP